MSLTVYSFPKDIRVAKIAIAANILGLDVKQEEVPTVSDTEVKVLNPGKLPFLRTEEGTLAGTNTILRYLCVQRSGLYGTENFSASLIDAWVDWSSVIALISASWLYPIWGLEHEDVVNRDISAVNLFRELTYLNTHLAGRGFLVGSSFSLADLSDLYTTVLDNNFRSHFPEVSRWLSSVLQKEEIVRTIGDVVFCKVAPGPPLPNEIFDSSPIPSLVALLKQDKRTEPQQKRFKAIKKKPQPPVPSEMSVHSFEEATRSTQTEAASEESPATAEQPEEIAATELQNNTATEETTEEKSPQETSTLDETAAEPILSKQEQATGSEPVQEESAQETTGEPAEETVTEEPAQKIAQELSVQETAQETAVDESAQETAEAAQEEEKFEEPTQDQETPTDQNQEKTEEKADGENY